MHFLIFYCFFKATVEEVEEDFGDGYFAPYQKALWDLFEKPQSSWPAKVFESITNSQSFINSFDLFLTTYVVHT